MTDIIFYTYTDGRWIERETLTDPLLSELYDKVSELNEKYKTKNWAIPEGHDPANYPELLEMEKVVSRHLSHYQNDFYLHDLYSYLEGDKKGLWLLRDSGTHFIQMGESFSAEDMVVYKDYVRCNKYFYLIDHGEIKKLSLDKVYQLLEEKVSVAA
ncbi:hypothetical protein COJ01_17195 [Priestia megaterium]|uniref:hypothetical protein n=1 Tax=Priestia megaterium TaxID=1404 RepID=UPI000BF27BCF|nr:hypothetical protein [Priestia megaterium]PFK99808.1 hypothetical protein COJ01_17195 [Priestia megaterium]